MKTLTKEQYKEAASILRDGGIIAFPTETVFGLGVIFNNEASYERLINVKRRPPNKPFTLMCASKDDVYKYAQLNKTAIKLVEAFMPGQFTLICKAKQFLPSYVVSSEGNVGIRVPDDEFVQKLIKEVGYPLLVPSANKANEQPALNSSEAISIFQDEIDATIVGESKSNVPSTIVLVDNDIHLIREGLIKKEDIDKIIKKGTNL